MRAARNLLMLRGEQVASTLRYRPGVIAWTLHTRSHRSGPMSLVRSHGFAAKYMLPNGAVPGLHTAGGHLFARPPSLHPRSLDSLRIHEIAAEPLDVGDRHPERLRGGGERSRGV